MIRRAREDAVGSERINVDTACANLCGCIKQDHVANKSGTPHLPSVCAYFVWSRLGFDKHAMRIWSRVIACCQSGCVLFKIRSTLGFAVLLLSSPAQTGLSLRSNMQESLLGLSEV